MFSNFQITKATTPHTFLAPEQLKNASKVFSSDGTEVDLVCRFGLALFVHVTNSRIGEVLIDQHRIPRVEGTFFVHPFVAGFNAKYLIVGYI